MDASSIYPRCYEDSLARLLLSTSTPKLGLERIIRVLNHLGNPHLSFPSIHVAGTNGKGSTCAFLNSIALNAGLQVGLYTSPHLLSCRERIQINSNLIGESDFVDLENQIFEASKELGESLSFFEQMTAMAFCYFRRKKVDLAVIEVGLGGRLDATNVIKPIVSIITRIDLDHTDLLGDSLEKIAFEKAGIIKSGVLVVTGFQEPRVLGVIRKIAKERGSPLFETSTPIDFETGLLGEHQQKNAAIARLAIKESGLSITDDKIENGIRLASWPCRFERISTKPEIIIDGAHNASGIKALVSSLQQLQLTSNKNFVLVLGSTLGHDFSAMVHELLPIQSNIISIVLTKSKSPRANAPAKMKTLLASHYKTHETEDVKNALLVAKEHAGEDGLIIVAGTLYVAGEARGLFRDMPKDPNLPIF